MLQQNYNIESLFVTSLPSQQAKINLYLRINTVFWHLLCKPKTSMSDWVEILANNSKDLDIVHHLLQKMPNICTSALLVVNSIK